MSNVEGGHYILQVLPIKSHQPPYPIKNERSLKQLYFFSYLFFLTVGVGSFEKIPDTAEQCQHFEAICNKIKTLCSRERNQVDDVTMR